MTDTPTVPEPGHHHGAPAIFTKKIGPAPVWVYVVLVLGVGVGYRYYQSRASVAATGGGSDTGSVSDPTAASAGTDSVDEPASSLDTGTGVVSTPTGGTNAQWGVNAVTFLEAGGTSSVEATNAVTSFLNGTPLSPQYKALIDKALTGVGSPPEGLIPIGIRQPPAANPIPRPNAIPKTYKVKPGDTLGVIAVRYYGRLDEWTAIRNANRSKLPGNVASNTNLHNGIILTLPAAPKS